MTLVGSGIEDWTDEQWHERVPRLVRTVGATAHGDNRRVVPTPATCKADVTSAEDLRALLEACHGRTGDLLRAAAGGHGEGLRGAAGDRAAAGHAAGAGEAVRHRRRPAPRRSTSCWPQLVPEDQIHRVDHFLGKSTVLNILGLRFANRIFEPVLNAEHVEQRRHRLRREPRRSRAGPATTTAPARWWT